MNERVDSFEGREKVLPNQTLLFAEPIFKNPGEDESKKTKFTVPVGAETWVKQIPYGKFGQKSLSEGLGNEYLAICGALKGMDIPFRIIIAHREHMDLGVTAAILQQFNLRGLALDKSILETCFPRDMMMDFDGKTHISLHANFNFPDNSGIISLLGEGGKVLKLGKKVFIPDSRGYVESRKKYLEDVNSLSHDFQFGFLPFPLAKEVDIVTGEEKIFPNEHLDRVAAFIVGKNGGEYLLLDGNYTAETNAPYGQYWNCIKEACQNLDVTPVVVERNFNSIPYALNLEQFADGSILATAGDAKLTEVLMQIVGQEKVHFTTRPIVFYPIFRNGGIRCMMLHAPKKIVGEPIIK